MRRDLTELQQIYENTRGYETSMDLYIEQVLFNTDELYLQEGIMGNVSSMVKNAGAKVKDAFDKYNPQEIYNRAFVNISNKKAQLIKKHPTAGKLFKIAANPTNIKLAMMAIAILGMLQGVDIPEGGLGDLIKTITGAAGLGAEGPIDIPAVDVPDVDVPDTDIGDAGATGDAGEVGDVDDGAAENLKDSEEALQDTAYSGDGIDNTEINNHLDQLVEDGVLDQQAASQISLCVKMQDGLEMGSNLEGVTIDSYDKMIDNTTIITEDSGVTATGEETFESYIKASITGKDGNEIILSEIKTTTVIDQATGNVTSQEELGGLEFDITKVLEQNMQNLPAEQQEKLYSMIIGGTNAPVTESRRENDLIWESYITESNKQPAVADLKQLEAKFLKGMKQVATVMAQIASQKNIPAGQKVLAKQL